MLGQELLYFIDKHPTDFRERLAAKPYCLKMRYGTEDWNKDLIVFMYDMIKSDLSNPIVQACRGIIVEIEVNSAKIVAYPFDKFFNYGEGKAAVLNMNSITIQEKIDGSIIKVYFYKGEWRVATNGGICASGAMLESGKSFLDLYNEAVNPLDYDKLDKHVTYMFELTSPDNRIVVPHDEVSLTFLGARNMIDLKELNLQEHLTSVMPTIRLPKTYQMSYAEALKQTELLGFRDEGFVIVDNNFNRVKVKSIAYVKAHYLLTNGPLNYGKILGVHLTGETDEFLTYHPEMTAAFKKVEELDNAFLARCADAYEIGKGYRVNLLEGTMSRRDIAIAITQNVDNNYKYIAFAGLDGKTVEYKSTAERILGEKLSKELV